MTNTLNTCVIKPIEIMVPNTKNPDMYVYIRIYTYIGSFQFHVQMFYFSSRNTILVHGMIYRLYVACFWWEDGQGRTAYRAVRLNTKPTMKSEKTPLSSPFPVSSGGLLGYLKKRYNEISRVHCTFSWKPGAILSPSVLQIWHESDYPASRDFHRMKVQCNMQYLLDFMNYSQPVTDLLIYVKYVANIYALTTCYWKGTSHSTSIYDLELMEPRFLKLGHSPGQSECK